MKLQAVTICINYADYLECIVANRRHFDRWVVVTVAGDAATAAVCARHGIEVVLSKTLQADGKDFNAANNKSRALNEGLDALEQEGWVVILDSDVLLPRHFRERVEGLPLEKGCLYGVAGRKICEDREMFEMLRECEPWDRFCDRHSQTIGYFNLFHLEGAMNRYVKRGKDWGWSHDDWHFTTSFPPERIRQLPMTVIHTGPPGANWSGRVAHSYHADGAVAGNSELPGEIAGPGRVAVVGYFPGSRWRELARRFAKVLLTDHFQVHQPSGSPMVEADRVVLRGLWAKEAADYSKVELLGTHSVGTLAGIADGSLEALYLPGEVTPGWLAAALPHWLGKLRDGAVVCGDLYGLPHWPDATYAIALLLGTPVEVAANGFWWGRKRAGRVSPTRADETSGGELILINEGTADIERLLVTLHRVRQSWAGRVRLFHWGPENQALRIAAARGGVEIMEVGEVACVKTMAAAETLAAGLWPQAIYLPPGALVLGDVGELFSSGVEAGEFAAEQPWRMEGAMMAPASGRLAACHASEYEETKTASPNVLLCTGPVEAWTDAAWARWSEALTTLTVQLAAEIRTAADATVMILVGPEEIDGFEQMWMSLKFAPAVPVIVGLIGVPDEEIWLAPTGVEPQIVALAAADSARQRLAVLLALVQTERVIFLPPTARPLPGAELFPDGDTDEEAILDVGSIWPGEENEPLSKATVFGIFRVDALRRRCANDSVAERPGRHVDLVRKGWLPKAPSAVTPAPPEIFDAATSPL